MLDTFDPTNEMLLASVQELTTKLYALEKKFNEGGGGDLPEPTIADAGKVLGVDEEGEYALVEGGGGESGYDVTKEALYEDNNLVFSEQTIGEETLWSASLPNDFPLDTIIDYVANGQLVGYKLGDIRDVFIPDDLSGNIIYFGTSPYAIVSDENTNYFLVDYDSTTESAHLRIDLPEAISVTEDFAFAVDSRILYRLPSPDIPLEVIDLELTVENSDVDTGTTAIPSQGTFTYTSKNLQSYLRSIYYPNAHVLSAILIGTRTSSDLSFDYVSQIGYDSNSKTVKGSFINTSAQSLSVYKAKMIVFYKNQNV